MSELNRSPCAKCPKTFDTIDDLDSHIMSDHRLYVKCMKIPESRLTPPPLFEENFSQTTPESIEENSADSTENDSEKSCELNTLNYETREGHEKRNRNPGLIWKVQLDRVELPQDESSASEPAVSESVTLNRETADAVHLSRKSSKTKKSEKSDDSPETKGKKFKCKNCSYTSARVSNVKRHQKTHGGKGSIGASNGVRHEKRPFKPFKKSHSEVSLNQSTSGAPTVSENVESNSEKAERNSSKTIESEEIPSDEDSPEIKMESEKSAPDERSESNETRFKCKKCSYSSTKVSNVKRHQKQHGLKGDRDDYEIIGASNVVRREKSLKRPPKPSKKMRPEAPLTESESEAPTMPENVETNSEKTEKINRKPSKTNESEDSPETNDALYKCNNCFFITAKCSEVKRHCRTDHGGKGSESDYETFIKSVKPKPCQSKPSKSDTGKEGEKADSETPDASPAATDLNQAASETVASNDSSESDDRRESRNQSPEEKRASKRKLKLEKPEIAAPSSPESTSEWENPGGSAPCSSDSDSSDYEEELAKKRSKRTNQKTVSRKQSRKRAGSTPETQNSLQKDGEKPYACNQCDFKTNQKENLARHRKRKHPDPTVDGEKLHKCDLCTYATKHRRDLMRHVVTHGDKLNISCDKCDFKTIREEYLRTHQKTRHSPGSKPAEERRDRCDLCSYSTKSQQDLSRHIATHGAKTVQCDACDFKTKSRVYLARHARNMHSQRNPVLCDICGRSFRDLKNHMAVHSGMTYECGTCQKSFATKGGLDKHEKTHSGLKPNLCAVCGKGFLTSSHLKLHERIHSGDKPFMCDRCDYRCTQPHALKQHVLVHHKKEKRFVCGECGARFFQKIGLLRHQAHHADDPKEFREKYVKEKMAVCNYCGKSFRECMLKRHLVVHSKEMKFQCEICLKSFTQKDSLKTHRVVHTGEKPFKCDRCDKSYSQKYPLTLHKKNEHGQDSLLATLM